LTPWRRASRLAGCLLGLALAVAPAPALSAQDGADGQDALELRFLDVGQGDAILIRHQGLAVLVDASRGRDIVLLLAELEVDSFVAIVASHNHDDHIGGMPAVLADYPVGRYLYNGRRPANQNSEEIEETLEVEQIDAPAPPWEPIRLGDARITVFPTALRGNASENNSSLGVLVERGRFRALLTGDSEVEELNAWMEAGWIPDVDVLKAAHHGARNGVTPGWLQVTRPEVVVISVGVNSYGHPDPWALRYYSAGGRQVYRTDRDGTVIVTVDAQGNYKVATEGARR